MNTVEQKILLDQIFAAYKRAYEDKRYSKKSVDRGIRVLISRVVEGKTLAEIGSEFGISGDRIRQIEAKTYRRLAVVTKRLGLKGMF